MSLPILNNLNNQIKGRLEIDDVLVTRDKEQKIIFKVNSVKVLEGQVPKRIRISGHYRFRF